MRLNIIVLFCILFVAGSALAGGNTIKLEAKPGVKAADVAKAKDKIAIGTFDVSGAGGDVTLTMACEGKSQSLACEATKADGSVAGTSVSFQENHGKVLVQMVGATAGAPFKNVTVQVPGTIIQFGGQDMGEF